MSLKRVIILLGKELLYGPKTYIFVFAIVGPIIISLVVSLVFGSLFVGKPRLGVVDEGGSQLILLSQELTSVITTAYDAVPDMKRAVETGDVDVGFVIPPDFDSLVRQGERTEVMAYVWGESLAKDRAVLAATVINLIREVAGQEVPVEMESIILGGEASIPWNDRLLPLIVLMSVFLGGLMLPASLIIGEKEKRTLEAVVITPTTIADIFVSKGIFGAILSLFMGVLILVINQAFGTQPLLLVLILALGASMAAMIGLLLGALINSFTSLFATWKFGGILLFFPSLIYMFPQIPEWVARVFPTYYVIQPIVELSQRGGGWADIANYVFILIGLEIALAGVLVLVMRRIKRYTV
ncbi:ABC transporter permease [Chloroflexota bacterium]